ncbi:DUF4160 domain-containing protein [Candidatus Magnetobacterium casense]|uniref:DUF4160 domain-containing protein n=1 Tax=Candidatus Magnetobacterium casense TaxID=1455061 RepID=UPI003CC90AEF
MISIFYDDHNPPHFHAMHGDKKAIFSIVDLRIIEGALPLRAQYLLSLNGHLFIVMNCCRNGNWQVNINLCFG